MSTFKNTTKSKVRTEEDESFKQEKLFDDPPVKKVKVDQDIEASGELRQKTLNIMNRQLQAWKQSNDTFMKDLNEIITNLEADQEALKNNVQTVEQFSGCVVKCMQQATAANNEKLEAVRAIFSAFKNEAEGLILRGAIKPDDRPLWFDVYKAFPPTTEPKYARPKPENQSIRPILYKEDAIRAKFHAKGQGLSVNMLSLSGETQSRKLVQKYQQLQSEGVAEEELLQKSVEAVGSARQAAAESYKTPHNPDSVTAKVLADANLKNIFKE